MKILVTGGPGFVASHFMRYCLEKGDAVYCTFRWQEDMSRIDDIKNKIKMIPADLLDLSSLIRAIADNKPDTISHLAACSFVPHSFTNPIITVQTNTIGTVNLFEAVRIVKDYIDKNYDPLIHVVSSSEVYGKVSENELPITESHPFRPGNQYAIGKIGEDVAAQFYSNFGFRVIISRMFTHFGYGRTMESAEVNFAKQIALAENGGSKTIKHGNLSSLRTVAHISDACEAYYLLIKRGKVGSIYNIGGNEVMTVGQILDYMISLSPLKTELKKELDPDLLRKIDVTKQTVDCASFKKDVGWEPKRNARDAIKEVLEYWRSKIKHDEIYR